MSKRIKSKQTKPRGTYPPDLKREIAQRYLNGEYSYAVAAEQYGLSGKEVVKEFVKWYRKLVAAETEAIQQRKAELEATGQLKAQVDDEPLPDDPAELKRLLEQARGENYALRTLVRVVKEDFNIDMLKKPEASDAPMVGSPNK